MKVTPDPRRSWPATGAALGLALIVALGVTYWLGVQDRERYLRDRNFRLLQVLSSQTEQLLNTHVRVNARVDPKALDRYRISADGDTGILRLTLVPRPGEALERVPVESPDLATVRRVFAGKLSQGAFDTLVLSTRRGRVVDAVGRREAEVRATSMLGVRARPATMPPVAMRAFGDAITQEPVEIAGTEYQMFVHPCCGGETAGPNGVSDGGLVVVGLVDAAALNSAALAISPVMVLGGVALVMLLLVGWIFLKIALVGPQQRVTRRDVVRLWGSSLFGLGMATILLLTVAAYARLSADVDGQLRQLSAEIDARLTGEVTQAYGQATHLLDALREHGCFTNDGGHPTPDCQAYARAESSSVGDAPPFITFALLAADGSQRVKIAFKDSTRRQISVAERNYFRALAGPEAVWRGRACPDGCVVESASSWTTGLPQAVLAIPTGVPALPVAALAVPFDPILKAGLPQGFEFAIVDDGGAVHFHSDRERNDQENLGIETDQNRRLQALVLARRAGTFSMSYWGRPYRAHVTPGSVGGWSIVALHAKQHTRALVLEWTVMALLMLGLYVGAWIVGLVLVSPFSLAWLWPDALRRPWYLPLAGFAVLVVAAAAIATVLLDGGLTLVVLMALLVPAILWATTWAVLALRPPAVGQQRAWQELCRDYQWTATILLSVTAILPAAAFFALSYDRHVEAYVKEHQIAIARTAGGATCDGQPIEATGTRYHRVFYATTVECHAATATPDVDEDELPLEEFAPYFTSASVRWRELTHHQARDGSWTSSRAAGPLVTAVRGRDPGVMTTVTSPLPAWLDIHSDAADGAIVAKALLAVLLLPVLGWAAWAIVRYALRRVLLAEVVEPVRAGWHVESKVGQRLLILCDKPAVRARRITEAHLLSLTEIFTAPDVAAAVAAAVRAAEAAAPMRRLVIPDLAWPADDLLLLRREMVFLVRLLDDPQHTVLLLSDAPLAELTGLVQAAARSKDEAARWTDRLASLELLDVRPAVTANTAQAAPGSAVTRWARAVHEIVTRAVQQVPKLLKRWRMRSDWRDQLLVSEGGAHAVVASVCAELGASRSFIDGSLTRDQILEEIEDGAADLYDALWQDCDGDERVALERIARDGMVSATSRRVVRRLLTKGLVRKDPELRLMNESFRHFVLDGRHRQEVAALEHDAEPSLWDNLRVPLGMAALLAAAFLLATQREAFDATITMAAGLTAAVPTLVKLTNVLTQFASKAPPVAKGNA